MVLQAHEAVLHCFVKLCAANTCAELSVSMCCVRSRQTTCWAGHVTICLALTRLHPCPGMHMTHATELLPVQIAVRTAQAALQLGRCNSVPRMMRCSPVGTDKHAPIWWVVLAPRLCACLRHAADLCHAYAVGMHTDHHLGQQIKGLLWETHNKQATLRAVLGSKGCLQGPSACRARVLCLHNFRAWLVQPVWQSAAKQTRRMLLACCQPRAPSCSLWRRVCCIACTLHGVALHAHKCPGIHEHAADNANAAVRQCVCSAGSTLHGDLQSVQSVITWLC